MQSCGKFFYNIAVSRVQLSLSLGAVHYFVMNNIEKFKHYIFRTMKNDAERIYVKGIDFEISNCVLLN